MDGLGGTSNTYLYCALIASVKAIRKIILAIVTSRIATTLLPNGQIAH